MHCGVQSLCSEVSTLQLGKQHVRLRGRPAPEGCVPCDQLDVPAQIVQGSRLGSQEHLLGKNFRWRPRCCCALGISLGVFGGFYTLGCPILFCGVKVRRLLVRKYEIQESWGCTVLHAFFCPLAALIQMLMEVEEREQKAIGCCGRWVASENGAAAGLGAPNSTPMSRNI